MEKIHEDLSQFGRMHLFQPWPKYIENAIYAETFLKRGENYIVRDQKIKLVDQFTGRIFDDRTLRSGLHQALEAKEQLPINPPNSILARITRQRFFQLYELVCGMTGTASGSEEELAHFYGTIVIPLSPHSPCKRVEFKERYFDSWENKIKAIVNDIAQRSATGQPILVGTRTIRESQLIADRLDEANIDCTVLNGIQDIDEAQIVAGAGELGSICIATNMAGRGTDIKLSEAARLAGGLHVICTQRHDSRRIDRQLAGRSARQGDPGSCQFFISADDQLLQQNAEQLASKIARSTDMDGECRNDFSKDLLSVQNQIEKEQFQQRRKLVQHDNWMDHVRETMVNSK